MSNEPDYNYFELTKEQFEAVAKKSHFGIKGKTGYVTMYQNMISMGAVIPTDGKTLLVVGSCKLSDGAVYAVYDSNKACSFLQSESDCTLKLENGSAEK